MSIMRRTCAILLEIMIFAAICLWYLMQAHTSCISTWEILVVIYNSAYSIFLYHPWRLCKMMLRRNHRQSSRLLFTLKFWNLNIEPACRCNCTGGILLHVLMLYIVSKAVLSRCTHRTLFLLEHILSCGSWCGWSLIALYYQMRMLALKTWSCYTWFPTLGRSFAARLFPRIIHCERCYKLMIVVDMRWF